MEIVLITIGLFVVLVLPQPMQESGLVWTVYAVSIFWINFPRHVERAARKRIEKHDEQGYKRCDCCASMVKGSDTLCHHCKLEASYCAYNK